MRWPWQQRFFIDACSDGVEKVAGGNIDEDGVSEVKGGGLDQGDGEDMVGEGIEVEAMEELGS